MEPVIEACGGLGILIMYIAIFKLEKIERVEGIGGKYFQVFLLSFKILFLANTHPLQYNYGNYAASLNTALSHYYSYTAAAISSNGHNHHLVSTSGFGKLINWKLENLLAG